jgi:dTMP kinase
MPGSPVFVTFEGIEGSGKSTQIGRLAAALRDRGRRVTTTREPGGTPAGEWIRRLLTDPAAPPISPATELMLYLADRAQHLHDVIRPALAAGDIVLCDRFSDSTLAYQGYGRAGDLERVRILDAVTRDGCGPDLTFLLDCEVATGLERAARRPAQAMREDRFEREPEAFHRRVRAGFLELARREPSRFVTLDAAESADAVAAHVLAVTLERLAGRR